MSEGQEADALEQPAEYQRVTSQRVLFQRKHEQRVWAGDARRLGRLQTITQDALEQAYRAAVAAKGPAPDDKWEKIKHDGQLETLAGQLRLRVTVKGKEDRWRHEGDVVTILDAVELDEVVEVQIGNPFNVGESRYEIDLRLRRNNFLEGVDLTVKGSDRLWVDGVFESLREELGRCEPSWSFVRRPVFPFVVPLVAFFATIAYLSIRFPSGSLDQGQQVTAWMYMFGGFWATIGLLLWALPRVFPNFEVLPHGQRSTGARRLAVALGAIGFVLANVAIPVLLSGYLD